MSKFCIINIKNKHIGFHFVNYQINKHKYYNFHLPIGIPGNKNYKIEFNNMSDFLNTIKIFLKNHKCSNPVFVEKKIKIIEDRIKNLF